jgi:copper(I)-binding protein
LTTRWKCLATDFMKMLAGTKIMPDGAAMVLRPGGAHIMLELLKRGRYGPELPFLSLTFQRAGRLRIEVRVESSQGGNFAKAVGTATSSSQTRPDILANLKI